MNGIYRKLLEAPKKSKGNEKKGGEKLKKKPSEFFQMKF